MRTMVFNVRIDGRTFSFYSGVDALDFMTTAARAIVKKPWERELPDLGIVLDIVEPQEPEEPEELRCDEKLEKECEA